MYVPLGIYYQRMYAYIHLGITVPFSPFTCHSYWWGCLRILQQCQSVLHEQLLAWVSHGIICDPHEEFFLSERNSLAMSTSRDTDESNNIEGGGGLVADATLTLAIEVSAESMVFDSVSACNGVFVCCPCVHKHFVPYSNL